MLPLLKVLFFFQGEVSSSIICGYDVYKFEQRLHLHVECWPEGSFRR